MQFPSSPTLNQTYTYSNKTWKWNGKGWQIDTTDSLSWANITGKPTEFTPSAHSHTISNVTGLQSALDSKLATGGKAADSDLLDGLDSSQFIKRADSSEYEVLRIETNNTATYGYKIKTNIPVGAHMCYLKLEGGQDGYTNSTLAYVSWYYYNSLIYDPRFISFASGTDGLSDFWIGAEDGKFVLFIADPGYYTAFRVCFLRYGVTKPPEVEMSGWTWADEDMSTTPSTPYVKAVGGICWSAANDGAGSGMDADLLDGQHGSYYLNYSNFTGTIPTWNQNTTGSAAKLTTARTLTIGSTGKLFDGTANVSWSISEIGAAPTSHVGSTGDAHGVATTSVNGFMSSADKSKLDGIATGAEVNQNTFSTFAVSGQSNVVADAKSDTLTLVGGTGVTITTNASTDTITFTNSAPDQTVSLTGSGATTVTGTYPNFIISSTDTTYSLATATTPGLIELGSNTVQSVAANAVSSTASRTYAVQLNVNGQAVVNVPWDSSIGITNDTSTNTSQYPAMARATSGNLANSYVSSTKLYFNPSTGTLNSTNFNSLSDRNFKTNIEPIHQDTVNKFSHINPVSFEWKDTGKSAFGVIAQEIEPLFPELVNTNEQDVKSVSYDQLVPILISVVQQQQREIDSIKAKLGNLS